MTKVEIIDGINFTKQLVTLGYLSNKEFKTVVGRIEKDIRFKTVENHIKILDELHKIL